MQKFKVDAASENKVETNVWTDGRTDGRTKAIALRDSLMQLGNILPLSQTELRDTRDKFRAGSFISDDDDDDDV